VQGPEFKLHTTKKKERNKEKEYKIKYKPKKKKKDTEMTSVGGDCQHHESSGKCIL
jgi:hypothetical protein